MTATEPAPAGNARGGYALLHDKIEPLLKNGDIMLDAGVRIRMDGLGCAVDNIFTERLWRTVKYKEVYLNEYHSP